MIRRRNASMSQLEAQVRRGGCLQRYEAELGRVRPCFAAGRSSTGPTAAAAFRSAAAVTSGASGAAPYDAAVCPGGGVPYNVAQKEHLQGGQGGKGQQCRHLIHLQGPTPGQHALQQPGEGPAGPHLTTHGDGSLGCSTPSIAPSTPTATCQAAPGRRRGSGTLLRNPAPPPPEWDGLERATANQPPTCMLMSGPNMSRAAATAHSSSSSGGSGQAAIAVPGLDRKFWMISSWREGGARVREEG
ncbi:hypothetical protein TSOC_011098 [Tetrabaena socialis]|uniref:Uncharacterized protein n=1 Tax=Tetrabaena socialis TaxID=47790 RepID=A0A2J7ZRI5_9CHLO|nr:hypothetical protein TSOC_011098 [Tetrabaena socialis]|eukprot:PNH02883.1 hypothetical protein TSOC_011098 [Tetrabaena socialis]